MLQLLLNFGLNAISFFIKDVVKRQAMQDSWTRFIKHQQQKGSEIVTNMDDIKAQQDELKKTRPEGE